MVWMKVATTALRRDVLMVDLMVVNTSEMKGTSKAVHLVGLMVVSKVGKMDVEMAE